MRVLYRFSEVSSFSIVFIEENNFIRSVDVLDLFCGAGGFSEGFRQAGAEIVAGIDNDSKALETYDFNFPNSVNLDYDLSSNDIPPDLSLINNVDVVTGGPPCQGFSIAGHRNTDDPRNKLFQSYVRILDAFKPSFVIIENVPNIMSMGGGIYVEGITSSLKSCGYNVEIYKIDCSEFGVPQSRKRVFFIGSNRNSWSLLMSKVDNPIFNEKVSCYEALCDLPSLENEIGEESARYIQKPQNNYQRIIRKGSRRLFNHVSVQHKTQTVDTIKLVPDGGNYKSLPKELQSTRKVNIAWTRMNSKKPCFTIDAGHNHHFHYEHNRVPTVRECARIQSFPDKFKFLGTRTSQYRQVGNAVPPLVSKVIAEELMKS